ncbi:hypothetical protein HK102_001009, partial [Quaeritorhiza haematococci]
MEDVKAKINRLVHYQIHYQIRPNENFELEFRIPVPPNRFDVVRDHLCNTNNTNNTSDVFEDYCYATGLRKRIFSDGRSECIKKTLVDRFRLHDWGVNAVLSREKPGSEPPCSETPRTIRVQNRSSFSFDLFRIDLSKVGTHDVKAGTTKVTHHLEIEYIADSAADKATAPAVLFEALQSMVELIQGSKQVRTVNELETVRSRYQQHTGQTYFVGAQPESFQKSHLDAVNELDYLVTPKTDGFRSLVFIDCNGHMWSFEQNLHVRCLNIAPVPGIANSLLDAEIVGTDPVLSFPDCHQIFVFDVLMVRGREVRNREDFRSRLRLVEELVAEIATGCVCVFAKTFLALDQIPGLWTAGPVRGDDGLIFVPIFEPYPLRQKWESCLKWKPPHLNTVDFVVHAGQYHVINNDNTMIPFPEQGPHVIRPELEKKVVECGWDGSGWVVHRVRQDKDCPNHVSVATNVWKSIAEPMLINDLVHRYCQHTGFLNRGMPLEKTTFSILRCDDVGVFFESDAWFQFLLRNLESAVVERGMFL